MMSLFLISDNQRTDATIPDIISELPSLYGIFFGESTIKATHS